MAAATIVKITKIAISPQRKRRSAVTMIIIGSTLYEIAIFTKFGTAMRNGVLNCPYR